MADADDADRRPDDASMKKLLSSLAVFVSAVAYGVGTGIAAGPPGLLQPGAQRSTADGVYTADQAGRGREQYRKRCVLCHLDRGQGREAEPFVPGQSLEREGDAEAPPVAGDPFLKKWDGHSVGELYQKVSTTMPVAGAGTLTPQQYADVLAYLFELNKLPAGQDELPATRGQLDLITIGR